MNFIIDANNLAGKLGILKESDFDKKLIEIIRDWLGSKQKTVVLVFDSLDPMGDRLSYGFLEIIYSPRDGYYKTADDKIVEIFTQWANWENIGNSKSYNLNIIERLRKDDLVFVSDDLDLKNKVKNIQYNIREKIKILGNDDFIALLNKGEILEDIDEYDDRGIQKNDIAAINNELLRIWKK